MACLIFMTLSFFVGWHGHYEVNSMISKNGMSNIGLTKRDMKEIVQQNETLINSHASLVSVLMRDIKEAVTNGVNVSSKHDNITKKTNITQVLITTTGMTYIPRVDICINQFNRIILDEAHKQGFPVLDKAEIERRLVSRSLGHPKPAIKNSVHLDKPGPAIISTALLHIISCQK